MPQCGDRAFTASLNLVCSTVQPWNVNSSTRVLKNNFKAFELCCFKMPKVSWTEKRPNKQIVILSIVVLGV